MKLASGVQQYERSCMFMGEIQDRDEKIGIKNSEIVGMKRHLDELRISLKDSETSRTRIHLLSGLILFGRHSQLRSRIKTSHRQTGE